MKAASEEVQNILEGSGQKPDPNNPKLTLSREQLDSMPVLGKVLSAPPRHWGREGSMEGRKDYMNSSSLCPLT